MSSLFDPSIGLQTVATQVRQRLPLMLRRWWAQWWRSSTLTWSTRIEAAWVGRRLRMTLAGNLVADLRRASRVACRLCRELFACKQTAVLRGP